MVETASQTKLRTQLMAYDPRSNGNPILVEMNSVEN
jgi:hypothetical protein